MLNHRVSGFADKVASRKNRLVVALACLLLIAAFVLFARNTVLAAGNLNVAEAPTEQKAVAGSYRWSYSIKFVCGYQPELKFDPGVAFREPVVKPGNYATDININNPQAKELPLNKWITVMVQGQEVLAREPASIGPHTKLNMVLKPYHTSTCLAPPVDQERPNILTLIQRNFTMPSNVTWATALLRKNSGSSALASALGTSR